MVVRIVFEILFLGSCIFSFIRSRESRDAPGTIQQPIFPEPPTQPLEEFSSHRFTLRHIFHHGTYLHPALYRKKDIWPQVPLFLQFDDGSIGRAGPLIAQSQFSKIQRLKDRRPSIIEPILANAREQWKVAALPPSAWSIDHVLGPNVTDKATILTLAQMAIDAYAINETSSDWDEIDGGFNRTNDFGWETDGLRGHVYADDSNSTVIIGFKGTSTAFWNGGGTITNDRENDNLFASCCCAQQSLWGWRQVCDCATSLFTCNNTCVATALRNESRYYAVARLVYSDVTLLYPKSNIWVVGHSLGGTVSSLIGLTYGLPTVTFQAVPDALAAIRLGLPESPGSHPGIPQARLMTGSYHIGHTADPVYMGSCNGIFSPCTIAGYSLESQCHTGQRCVYDVVADKGWRVDLRLHSLRTVIDDIIKDYDTVPICESVPECRDCYNWKYFENNDGSLPTTSQSTISSTSATCRTPGWWGCLDKTTTTLHAVPPSSTTSTSTTTCGTPG